MTERRPRKHPEVKQVINPNELLEARRAQIEQKIFPETLVRIAGLNWQPALFSTIEHDVVQQFLSEGVQPWHCTRVAITADLNTVRTNADGQPVGVLLAQYNTHSGQVIIQELDAYGLSTELEVRKIEDPRSPHDNYQLTYTKGSNYPDILQESAIDYKEGDR